MKQEHVPSNNANNQISSECQYHFDAHLYHALLVHHNDPFLVFVDDIMLLFECFNVQNLNSTVHDVLNIVSISKPTRL